MTRQRPPRCATVAPPPPDEPCCCRRSDDKDERAENRRTDATHVPRDQRLGDWRQHHRSHRPAGHDDSQCRAPRAWNQLDTAPEYAICAVPLPTTPRTKNTAKVPEPRRQQRERGDAAPKITRHGTITRAGFTRSSRYPERRRARRHRHRGDAEGRGHRLTRPSEFRGPRSGRCRTCRPQRREADEDAGGRCAGDTPPS